MNKSKQTLKTLKYIADSIRCISDEKYRSTRKLRLSERQLITIRDFGKPGKYVHYGPFGCGKTYALCAGFGLYLMNETVTDVGFAVLGQSLGTIKKVICSELEKLFGDNFKYIGGKKGSTEFELFGHTVYMVGLSDSKSEERIRGLNVRGIYHEEASLCSEDVYNTILGRLRDLASDTDDETTWYIMSTNPDAKKHWLNLEILSDDSEVVGIHWTKEDNVLPKAKAYYDGLMRKYAKCKSLLMRYVYGLWESSEGQVYSCFDEDYHVIDINDIVWEEVNYIKVGMDYGMTNATAALIVAYMKRDKVQVVIDEIYKKDTINSDLSSLVINILNKYNKRIKGVYLDPSAKSMILQLKRDGVRGVVKADNDVKNGISRVFELLSSGRLFICSHCVNTIDEFGLYSYKKNDNCDEVLKANDHCMDALRYCIYTPYVEGDEVD